MQTTRSTNARTIRGTTLAASAATTAAVGLLAIVALGAFAGFGPGGHDGGAIVPPPATATPPPTVAPAPTATPAPSERPAPSALPTPSARPTAHPTDGGSDALPLRVRLANATDAAVSVDVVDRSGRLVGARSGRPGDGASVDGDAIAVENLDATTLRLTWVDFPIDNSLSLFIDRVDGHLRLLLVQPEPDGATDAIGFDRELVLTFSEPIAASSVEAILQDGLDTPG